MPGIIQFGHDALYLVSLTGLDWLISVQDFGIRVSVMLAWNFSFLYCPYLIWYQGYVSFIKYAGDSSQFSLL